MARTTGCTRINLQRHTDGRKGRERQPWRSPVEDEGKDPLPYWPDLSHLGIKGCGGIGSFFYVTKIDYRIDDPVVVKFGDVTVSYNGLTCNVSGQAVFDDAWHHGMNQRHEKKWEQALAYKRAHPEQFENWEQALIRERQDHSYPVHLESALADMLAKGSIDSEAPPTSNIVKFRRERVTRRDYALQELERIVENVGEMEKPYVEEIYGMAEAGELPIAHARQRIQRYLSGKRQKQRGYGSNVPDTAEPDFDIDDYTRSVMQGIAENHVSPNELMFALEVLKRYHKHESMVQVYVNMIEAKEGRQLTAKEIREVRQWNNNGNKKGYGQLVMWQRTYERDASNVVNPRKNAALLWRVEHEGVETVSEMHGVDFKQPRTLKALTDVAGLNGGRTGQQSPAGSDYRPNPIGSHHYEHLISASDPCSKTG
jgi:hypothetical protein